MPVTLEQAQINARDDISFAVIDNLRRYSWVLDQLVFDDTATPSTGGGSMVYGYTRLKTPRGAAFRAINAEYTPAHAEREHRTVLLKVLGGSFQVDRVISNLGPSATNEVAFQMQQLLTGIRTVFQDALINGDSAVDENSFDGLDKALVGEDTEYVPADQGVSGGYLDWSSIDSQEAAMRAWNIIDDWLSGIVPSTTGGGDLGAPGALPPGVKAILGNTTSITRLRQMARWAGMYTASKDDLGRHVERYGSWVLVDIGDNALGTGPIIPIESREIEGNPVSGLTDLYAVSFGLDAFHGASMAGKPLVETYMPDFTSSGAVKTGEIEMGPVAPVLRNTRSCGVLRNVKVR